VIKLRTHLSGVSLDVLALAFPTTSFGSPTMPYRFSSPLSF
jgi:hypothetical protein